MSSVNITGIPKAAIWKNGEGNAIYYIKNNMYTI